jgi:glycosyltransferase involved in cell wall biosynthesis
MDKKIRKHRNSFSFRNTHIILLNTAHYSLDDRVFYHQAKSLSENGYRVTIISTIETMKDEKGNIKIFSCNFNSLSPKEKQQKITELLYMIIPDIVICDTPIAVLAAHKYCKEHEIKIIYDVTEWYPSINNLKNIRGLNKWIRCIALMLFNLYAGYLSNGFIFGEYYKSTVFRFLYFRKPFVFLPYFPDLKYIEPIPIRNIEHSIRLFYGGNLRHQRGMQQVIQSTIKAAKRKPETTFQLHLVCNLLTEKNKFYFNELTNNMPSNVEILHKQLLPFSTFCQYITRMDIYFDLRRISWEHSRSLPIKLFYYLACGRPVIYSKLKSITAFFPDISCGHFVNPSKSDVIADCIVNYIDNQDIYAEHCQKALSLSKEKYNWNKIKGDFIRFIAFFMQNQK